jgi:PAS domain S-box-containing protein
LDKLSALRKRAEKKLKKKTTPSNLSCIYANKPAHELAAHRSECEKQNEERLKAREGVETSSRRREAEEQVLRSKNDWEKTFNAVPDSICILDVQYRIVQVNKAMAERLGLSPEQCIGLTCFKAVHGKESPAKYCPHSQTLKDGLPHTIELYEENLGGYFMVSTSPLTDIRGKVVGSVHVARDITERKQAEEARKASERRLKASLREKDTLLKEVHHRVKNNLQLISSLLSLQCAQIKDKKAIEMLRESQDRIRSLAMIHEKLYRSKSLVGVDASQCVRDLVSHLLSVYKMKDTPVKVQFSVDDIFFGIDTAVPCGLVINELVSNALKHAFRGRRNVTNSINIEFHRYRRMYRLVISDNGIGFPGGLNFRKTGSLGLQLVVALVKQMGGRISLKCKNGTRISVTFGGTKAKNSVVKP